MAKLATRLVCTAVLIAVLTGGAWAVLLTDSQLYYDPWAVPLADRPTIDLESTSISPTVTYTWPQSDVEGVKVLPMLKRYSTADPGGYPTGYAFTQADYFYQPNLVGGDGLVDYQVDLTAGVATATFNRPGGYHVLVDCSSTPDIVYTVFVNSVYFQGAPAASTPCVDIDGPVADLVVVSQPSAGDKGCDMGAANAADDNGAGKVARAGSAQDAIDKIKAASEAAGKKIHVELNCHGHAGSLKMGDTRIGGAGADMSIEDFQKALDPYVNNLSIYACDFAKGADGEAAMKTLAESLGIASAFNGKVSAHRMDFGWFVLHGWDLELGAKKVVAVSLAPIIRDIKKVFGGWLTVLPSATVTAVFENSIYVEADNRSCGIEVLTQQLPMFVSPGVRVDIQGSPGTDANGEICVYGQVSPPVGTGLIKPLATTVRSLGGGPFGFQHGVTGGVGLNNIGLLVRASGMMMYQNAHTFMLSSGGASVKCITPSNVTVNPFWTLGVITGISSCEHGITGTSSVLKIRDMQDIRTL